MNAIKHRNLSIFPCLPACLPLFLSQSRSHSVLSFAASASAPIRLAASASSASRYASPSHTDTGRQVEGRGRQRPYPAGAARPAQRVCNTGLVINPGRETNRGSASASQHTLGSFIRFNQPADPAHAARSRLGEGGRHGPRLPTGEKGGPAPRPPPAGAPFSGRVRAGSACAGGRGRRTRFGGPVSPAAWPAAARAAVSLAM